MTSSGLSRKRSSTPSHPERICSPSCRRGVASPSATRCPPWSRGPGSLGAGALVLVISPAHRPHARTGRLPPWPRAWKLGSSTPPWGPRNGERTPNPPPGERFVCCTWRRRPSPLRGPPSSWSAPASTCWRSTRRIAYPSGATISAPSTEAWRHPQAPQAP